MCRSQQNVEDSSWAVNMRPPYLPLEKPVCRSRSNRNRHGTRLGENWERSTPKLYIFTLLIQLICGYIIQNSRLDKTQPGIKIAGRNINNLRYADDTTVAAQSEEELKRLLMKVKEETEKAGLKLNIQKTKIIASSLIFAW